MTANEVRVASPTLLPVRRVLIVPVDDSDQKVQRTSVSFIGALMKSMRVGMIYVG